MLAPVYALVGCLGSALTRERTRVLTGATCRREVQAGRVVKQGDLR